MIAKFFISFNMKFKILFKLLTSYCYHYPSRHPRNSQIKNPGLPPCNFFILNLCFTVILILKIKVSDQAAIFGKVS